MGMTCFLLAGAPVFASITDLAIVMAHYRVEPTEALSSAAERGALYAAEDTVRADDLTPLFNGGAVALTLEDGSRVAALAQGVKCDE